MKCWIFRFGNVIGNDTTRGVIFDLVNKLKKNQDELEVLGNGQQVKDYVNIDDCLNAILHTFSKVEEKINVFNLSSGTKLSVQDIVKIILEEMNLKNTKIKYAGGPQGWGGGGWKGDVKIVHYDISKLKKTGWSPKLSSADAVRLAVRGTIENN